MSIITARPEWNKVTEEEKKLGYYKYYEMPLYTVGPREQAILDFACPYQPKYTILAKNWLDLLQPEVYQPMEYGYSMMPDGSGYIAVYTVYPGNCTPKMLAWWFRWLNVHSKSMPKGHGNLKYKIWNPADHFEHGFINGKDKSDGIYTIETLDLGAGGDIPVYTVRHAIDLKKAGLTEERRKALADAGCWVDAAWESFHPVEDPSVRLPGTHLCLTLSRPNPLGGMEKISREWIGYGINEDGEVFFDESTPKEMLCNEYLRKVLIHSTTEAQQLALFLPSLYEEYHDLPDDAD